MRRTAAVLLIALIGAGSASARDQVMEATTADGEKVRLLPDGRWEYADAQKAAVQRQAVEADLARERSSQGGLLGLGRRVYEGDKDYNRGSLNPKMR